MKIPSRIQKAMKRYPLFYQKVWKACAGIPRGETRTYGEIARQSGHPRAARAVGQALAANPFAPVIPCHRVVGAHGAMGGYSAPGGVRKKRRLLRRERNGGFTNGGFASRRGPPFANPLFANPPSESRPLDNKIPFC